MPTPSFALARIAFEASSPMTSSISCLTRLRLGAGQIDLVDHWQDFEIEIQRHMNVGDGLRFDALGRVDDQ